MVISVHAPVGSTSHSTVHIDPSSKVAPGPGAVGTTFEDTGEACKTMASSPATPVECIKMLERQGISDGTGGGQRKSGDDNVLAMDGKCWVYRSAW